MATGVDGATMVQVEGLVNPAGSTASLIARNPLRWFVFAVVIAANIMDLMDATIVNVAGPSIRHALGGSASTLEWLPAGYTLAFAVFLITGARLGDMFGRRRLFLIGLGAGASIGQLFDFILAGVGMDEVGSASGVLEAVQQLSSAVGSRSRLSSGYRCRPASRRCEHQPCGPRFATDPGTFSRSPGRRSLAWPSDTTPFRKSDASTDLSSRSARVGEPHHRVQRRP